jgi:hypothetical protein
LQQRPGVEEHIVLGSQSRFPVWPSRAFLVWHRRWRRESPGDHPNGNLSESSNLSHAVFRHACSGTTPYRSSGLAASCARRMQREGVTEMCKTGYFTDTLFSITFGR